MPVADGGVRVNAERSRAAVKLRRRLLAGVVAGILITAGIAIATLAASTSELVHQQLLDRAASDARALALALSGPLSRGHLRTAAQEVEAASEMPDLLEATLADAAGSVLLSTDASAVGQFAPPYHADVARTREAVPHLAGSPEAGPQALLLVYPVLGEALEGAGEPPVLGTLALRFSTARISAAIRNSVLFAALWVLAGAGAIGFAVFSVLQAFALRPVERLVATVEQMAAGDLDARVDREQLGALRGVGDTLNEMWGGFGSLASRVAGITARLQGVSTRLAGAMGEIATGSHSQEEAAEETASLLAQVNAAVKDVNRQIETLSRSTEEASSSSLELASSVDEVARSVGSLNEAVETASSSSQEMGASIRQVAESADEVQRMAEETAASMTEMDRAIQEVGDHVARASELTERVAQGAEEGSEAVRNTIQGIEEIRSSTGQARDVLERLVLRIGEIGEILTVIREINDETNLLSLNAAIIAAQAGEQGKAFAVVANHVKTLAQRTAASTQEIARLIRSVQDESRNAVTAMEAGIDAVQTGVERSRRAGESLSRIQSLASDANARVSEITRAAQEQGRNSVHVADAANRTSAMVQKISAAMAEQSRASESMLRTSEAALSVCRQVQRSTEEQRESGSFISESISQIGEMMRSIQENMASHQHASESVADAVQRVLDVARKTGGRVPEMVSIVEELRRDAEALLAEVGRFRAGAAAAQAAGVSAPQPSSAAHRPA
jgi:methyl-accepting chemotaxis protein